MKCKRNCYLLQLSAPLLQLHQGRISATRPRREPPPPVKRRGASRRRGCSLPTRIQSSLCPPRLQLRGCVRLTLTHGCSPPVKRMNRSIVQKLLASWLVKQGGSPAHPGAGASLLIGPESFFRSLVHTVSESTSPPHPHFCLCSNNLTYSE